MSQTLSRVLELADEIENYPLHDCDPSDDSDKQSAYVNGFRDIAHRFISSAKRLGDQDLFEQLVELNSFPQFLEETFELKAQLIAVIDYLRDVSTNPDYGIGNMNKTEFIDQEIISQMRAVCSLKFDLTKLIRYCEELNDSFRRGNYLACILLIRAVMNHVPPIFGKDNFKQVISAAGRSHKAILLELEDNARPVADLHTHMTIRHKESLPTKNQVEPFKVNFEVLIQEVIVELNKVEQ